MNLPLARGRLIWILSGLVLAVALVALTIGSIGRASVSVRAQILKAARAPYIAFERREANALCGDFTPTAAKALGKAASESDSCETRVSELFSKARTLVYAPLGHDLLKGQEVVSVSLHGNRGTALFPYHKGDETARFRLRFEKEGSRWRISTPPMLVEFRKCLGHRVSRQCKRNETLAFFAEEFVSSLFPRIIPPPAVKQAGGSELREFEAGSRVALESGCLACHKIAQQGNRGPGQDLTRVGASLTQAQIEDAILSPTAPMPSFKRLPKTKFRSLVRFLTLSK